MSKKKCWELEGRSKTNHTNIIKIGTIWGLVARHGLIFAGNEADHLQEAFYKPPGPPGGQNMDQKRQKSCEN